MDKTVVEAARQSPVIGQLWTKVAIASLDSHRRNGILMLKGGDELARGPVSAASGQHTPESPRFSPWECVNPDHPRTRQVSTRTLRKNTEFWRGLSVAVPHKMGLGPDEEDRSDRKAV